MCRCWLTMSPLHGTMSIFNRFLFGLSVHGQMRSMITVVCHSYEIIKVRVSDCQRYTFGIDSLRPSKTVRSLPCTMIWVFTTSLSQRKTTRKSTPSSTGSSAPVPRLSLLTIAWRCFSDMEPQTALGLSMRKPTSFAALSRIRFLSGRVIGRARVRKISWNGFDSVVSCSHSMQTKSFPWMRRRSFGRRTFALLRACWRNMVERLNSFAMLPMIGLEVEVTDIHILNRGIVRKPWWSFRWIIALSRWLRLINHQVLSRLFTVVIAYLSRYPYTNTNRF